LIEFSKIRVGLLRKGEKEKRRMREEKMMKKCE
jgi:hypothetical protein